MGIVHVYDTQIRRIPRRGIEICTKKQYHVHIQDTNRNQRHQSDSEEDEHR